MSDPYSVTPPGYAAEVEDNPKKPWKAIAAAVTAFVVVFLVLVLTDDEKLTGEDLAQYLGTAALLSGLPGLGSFYVPNPKRPKKPKKPKKRNRR